MIDYADIIATATRTLETETEGLKALIDELKNGLGDVFVEAVQMILGASGRVVLSGMGKSGHIARKIAATMASTGTPALHVHPAEASHGDLGMITRQDVIVMISNSGETPELAPMIDYAKRFRIRLVAMTSRADSSLAQAADLLLLLPRSPEACPIGLAPTTSTTMQLALGDALSVALLKARGFTARDFRDYHPGGKLGSVLKKVADMMHGHDELPLTRADASMSEALLVMTGKRFGCVGVVSGEGHLRGIITDGDLRRAMERHADLLSLTAGDVMTENPKTVHPEDLAAATLELMNRNKITVAFVVEDGKPIGLVHIHDLLREGVK